MIMSVLLLKMQESWSPSPVWLKAAVVGGSVLVAGAVVAKLLCHGKKRDTPIKKDWKTGIVYLYEWPRVKQLPNASSYCLKLETWLRISGIEYEAILTHALRSREGMLPFVELNGVEYPDSGFAIRDLTRELKINTDAHLTDEQLTVARAIEIMVENSTFMSYSLIRYAENGDVMFRVIKEAFGDKVGIGFSIMMSLMSIGMRRRVMKMLEVQGIGRHERADIINIGLEDLKSLSRYLGGNQYFMGDKPTRVDCAVFSVLAQLMYFPIASPHLDYMKSDCTNLVDFCDRIKQVAWPDWDDIHKQNETHVREFPPTKK